MYSEAINQCYREAMEKYPGKNEGLERKNHVTFSASRCTGYTYPLKTRRDYHTIPLYKCGELPSIRQMGALYSKQDLEERGLLSTIVTGGNPLSHSLDRTRSNWDKVSLSFTPYIPMAYNTKRSQHLCFFQINPEVAGWLNVVFTDSNATKNGHIRGLGLRGLNNVQFNVMHVNPFSVNDWFRFVQAEVLIPNSLPLTFVTEIGFVSSASMNGRATLTGGWA